MILYFANCYVSSKSGAYFLLLLSQHINKRKSIEEYTRKGKNLQSLY